MEFWKVAHPADAPAAIDTRTGKVWCYRDLLREVARVETVLPQLGRKSLGLLFTQNRYECLVTYLAALRSGSALILLDSSLSADLLSDFLETYQPDWIFSLAGPAPFCGYQVSSSGVSGLFVRQQIKDLRIHPDLALLLTTSGSTGSPKLVRLTLGNLAANAGSISKYLGLTPDEKELGICLVDIGGGTTEVAVYQKGTIVHTAVIPIGGDHFTNDLAVVLRAPITDAERIKKKYGCALRSAVSEDEMVEVPMVGGRAPKLCPRTTLADILQPRAEELLGLIHDDIQRLGLDKEMRSGVVLTGGGSELEGVVEIAEGIFDGPVRRGVSSGVGGLVDVVSRPEWATATGLLLYGHRYKPARRRARAFFHAATSVSRFIRDFF